MTNWKLSQEGKVGSTYKNVTYHINKDVHCLIISEKKYLFMINTQKTRDRNFASLIQRQKKKKSLYLI